MVYEDYSYGIISKKIFKFIYLNYISVKNE